MTEPVLRTEGLCKRFGAVTATSDLTLALEQGEIHALIGPNGAGKTTAVNQIAGELAPDSGEIWFGARDVTAMPAHRRARLGLARSFQVTSVFDGFSVVQNVAMAVQAHRSHSFRFWRAAADDRPVQERAFAIVERLGLGADARRTAGTLAHGEKRRLEVAMALAGEPRVLLLDEPMAGAGPEASERLAEHLLGLKGELTMLLVEHDMDVVFSLADRVSVLVNGTLVATGTPHEIRAHPEVREAYLGDHGGC